MSQRILIFGSNGLCGHAIKKVADQYEHDFYYDNRSDLTEEKNVGEILERIQPTSVINCAAKVGGVGFNAKYPATIYRDNILINTNIINQCVKYQVNKLLCFSSVCAFPDNLSLLREDLLHSGPPSQFNFAYAYSKRMIDVQIEACRKEFGIKNWATIIPTNIAGENDNYNLENAHIIPALLHKMLISQRTSQPFTVWGTGEPKREVVFSEDIAHILIQLLEKDKLPPRLIISNSTEHSIKTIAQLVCKSAHYNQEIVWDHHRPNGQMSRPSDTSLFKSLFPQFKWASLEETIQKSWDWFQDNYPDVRL